MFLHHYSPSLTIDMLSISHQSAIISQLYPIQPPFIDVFPIKTSIYTGFSPLNQHPSASDHPTPPGRRRQNDQRPRTAECSWAANAAVPHPWCGKGETKMEK